MPRHKKRPSPGSFAASNREADKQEAQIAEEARLASRRRWKGEQSRLARRFLIDGAREAGYSVEDLIKSVRPNKSRMDRKNYDLLSRLVLTLRKSGITQQEIADFLSYPGRMFGQQQVSRLEAHGRRLEEEASRRAVARLPCKNHTRYMLDCPSCRRRYPQDAQANKWPALEGLVVAIGGDRDSEECSSTFVPK